MKNDKKYLNKEYTEITVITEAMEKVLSVSVHNSNTKPRRKINYSKKIMNDPFIMGC